MGHGFYVIEDDTIPSNMTKYKAKGCQLETYVCTSVILTGVY